MINCKNIGLFCGVAGFTAGAYFSISPILQDLNTGIITAYYAGLYSSVIATLLGLTTAVASAYYYHLHKNT